MADQKISALTAVTTPLAGTEVLPIVQSSTTKKVSAANMTTFMPAFSAYQSTSQSVPNNAWTKINLQTESFDTNSCFDTSTYKFTPNQAGIYLFTAQIQFQTAAYAALIDIYKNGASTGYSVCPFENATYFATGVITKMLQMNGTTDYVELYGYQVTGGAVDLTTVLTYFAGSMLRTA